MGYKMSMARIVSAANYAVGQSEEMVDVFQTNNTEDQAFSERFEAIPITPEEVRSSWLDWASRGTESEQNIHPIILDFLAKNTKYYYDYSEVESKYTYDYDESVLSTTPYPNYRTWDLTSLYLYECKRHKIPVQSRTLIGFIGESCFSKLRPYLEKEFVFADNEKHDFSTVIEDALLTRTPTLLASPSGVGKSHNIHRVSKKLGNVVIEVNLAELSRTDISGAPAKVSTQSYIGGLIENEELSKELSELSKNFSLPSSVTVRAPRKDVASKFKEAIETGRKVTLFFEEVTRVTNPSVMSSVFEAVSDHRIFGINFDPSQVSIICACNLGMQDTQDLDPAFLARMSLHYKDSYSQDDVESIRAYFKDNYSDYLNDYTEAMSDDRLIDWVSSVENREFHKSCSSTRGFHDLDIMLRDKNSQSLAQGTIIFNDSSMRRKMGKLDSVIDYKETKIFRDIIDKSINNWTALDSDLTINLGGDVATARELKQMYEEAKGYLDNGDIEYLDVFVTLLKAIFELDSDAQATREKLISYVVGEDMASDFCKYYNKVSGTALSRITIKELTNSALYRDYLSQQMRVGNAVQPERIREVVLQALRDIYKEFDTSLSVAHYRDFILGSLDAISTSDGRYVLLKEMIKDSQVEAIIMKSEDKDEKYIVNVLNKTGVPVDIDKVDKLVGKQGSAKPVYKTRFI